MGGPGNSMDRLLHWLEGPIHFFMWVALLGGFLMMGHISLDVAGRALWRPFAGTTEIVSGYYMILVAYLPWAMIARNDDHIMVDLFTRALPTKAKAWLDISVKIAMIVYVTIFAWQTWLTALKQMASRESLQVGGSYLIVWPSRYVLPMTGLLMAIYLVVRVMRDIRDEING